MPRFSEKQYTRHVLVAMTLYMAFMLLAWPMVHTVTSVALKVCLALVPVVPMMYVIALMFRRIRESDELEQRMHLVGLGVATAVLGVLSLIGGFLSAAGVLKLDGTVLIWVFPVTMIGYGVSRWWVSRRYGADGACDDNAKVPRYVWFLLGGVVAFCNAWFARHRLDDMSEGFLCGAGASFLMIGIALGFARWQRRRQAHD
jgi:amino acid transporter